VRISVFAPIPHLLPSTATAALASWFAVVLLMLVRLRRKRCQLVQQVDAGRVMQRLGRRRRLFVRGVRCEV